MADMNLLGKTLVLFGSIMIIVGAIFMLGGKLSWLGRLPGDIYVQKKSFTLFFPITTSILISILLTVIFMFIGRK